MYIFGYLAYPQLSALKYSTGRVHTRMHAMLTLQSPIGAKGGMGLTAVVHEWPHNAVAPGQ